VLQITNINSNHFLNHPICQIIYLGIASVLSLVLVMQTMFSILLTVCAVPEWGTICIGLTALLILLCCCGCLCRMCWKRRNQGKEIKKGLKGVVDLKSGAMLGTSSKESIILTVFKLRH